jgi:gentisate 1,2-dioxygenase
LVRCRFIANPEVTMKRVLAALCLSLTVASAHAASFPPLERKSVLEASLPAANPPGQPTGLHRHPASTVGVVTSGTIAFQPDGEAVRMLHAGDSFFEPAGHLIDRFDNASATDPASITVFYLTDSPSRPLIDMVGGK